MNGSCGLSRRCGWTVGRIGTGAGPWGSRTSRDLRTQRRKQGVEGVARARRVPEVTMGPDGGRRGAIDPLGRDRVKVVHADQPCHQAHERAPRSGTRWLLEQRPEHRDPDIAVVVPVRMPGDHDRPAVENKGAVSPALVHDTAFVDEEVIADVAPATIDCVEGVDPKQASGWILLDIGRFRVVQDQPADRVGVTRPHLCARGREAERLVGAPASTADHARSGQRGSSRSLPRVGHAGSVRRMTVLGS